MDNKKRVEILREIQQRAKEGDFDTADFISEKLSPGRRALEARDLMEESLADLVLKDTKYKIPGKGSTKAEVTSFLEKLLSESYPEINPDITIKERMDALGLYDPSAKKIELLADEVKKSPQKAGAAALHEGRHQLDNILMGSPNTSSPVDLKDIDFKDKVKRMGMTLDPSDAYEYVAANPNKPHHLLLSGRNVDKSFGRGGLASYLKGGKFGMLPGAIGVGGALLAGSADEALADVIIPGGVESLGKGSNKLLTEEQERDVDLVRKTSKDDKLNTARLKALQRMLGEK
jgi:hypothetical protein